MNANRLGFPSRRAPTTCPQIFLRASGLLLHASLRHAFLCAPSHVQNLLVRRTRKTPCVQNPNQRPNRCGNSTRSDQTATRGQANPAPTPASPTAYSRTLPSRSLRQTAAEPPKCLREHPELRTPGKV